MAASFTPVRQRGRKSVKQTYPRKMCKVVARYDQESSVGGSKYLTLLSHAHNLDWILASSLAQTSIVIWSILKKQIDTSFTKSSMLISEANVELFHCVLHAAY